MTDQPVTTNSTQAASRFVLWVDGVGAWLLCLGDRITVGGPTDPEKQADVSLLANLSRRHATFVRSGEGYLLEPIGPTCVGHRQISETTPLVSGYDIRLGSNVHLRFRLPSVLSGTAVLDFVSDHRPVVSVDGIVMMEDNCLLGPGKDQHVVCSGWTDSLVLFRRDGQFWCKSRNPVAIAGNASSEGGPIHTGDVVACGESRFRIEKLET